MSDHYRDDMAAQDAAILASRGMSPRVLDQSLMLTAQQWAAEMARIQQLSHAQMSARAASNGWRGTTLAENVAMGSDTAEGTYKQWMGSPGHRSNILDGSMNVAGFGHAITSSGEHYWSVNYGTRADAPPTTDIPPTSTNPPRRRGWLARLLGLFGITWCLLLCAVANGQQIPAGARRVVTCELHDLDTLTRATIDLGLNFHLVNQSIRLAGVDALEVSYTRQTVLKRQGAPLITDDEIRRGKEGTAKLAAIAKGGRWWALFNDEGSVYGRLEADVWLETAGGQVIRVADWIRGNGLERPE